MGSSQLLTGVGKACYTHVHRCRHTHACIHARTCILKHTHTHTHTDINQHTSTHTNTHAHAHAHAHTHASSGLLHLLTCQWGGIITVVCWECKIPADLAKKLHCMHWMDRDRSDRSHISLLVLVGGWWVDPPNFPFVIQHCSAVDIHTGVLTD